MKVQRKFPFRPTAGILTLFVLFATAVLAGPPLICHPFDIGNARSLPWISHDWNLSGGENYDTRKLAADTLAILQSDSTVLVHMETLRRATLYARKDPAAAKELMLKVILLTKSAQPDKRSQALVYFDAGYLAETYKQWLGETNPAANVNGYELVKEALRLQTGGDPQMEFAAALISLNGPATEHQEHAQKAIAGAKNDPLLAKNLASRFWPNGGDTLAEMISKTTVAKETKP